MSRRLFQTIRKYPKTAVFALLVLVVSATAAGTYYYLHRQWSDAQIALQEGRYADAKQNLRRCRFFWPRDVQVHLLSARAFRLTGDFETAEQHLNQCLKIQRGASDDVQLEFLLMRVQRGEVDEVGPILMGLVEARHPQSAMILETCSGAYMYNHRYRPALQCIYRWIAERPDLARPHQWRGWIYEQMGVPEDAIEEYRQALDLEPNLADVRLRYAEMLLNEKKPLAALPHLELLRKQYPDRADVIARLGQCRFMQGETEEARRLLTAAAPQLPNDTQLLLHLAKLELQDNHAVEAEDWLRKVIKLDPADTECLYTLVAVLELQGRKKEATETLDQYTKTKALLEQVNKKLREEVDTPSSDAQTAYEIGSRLLQLGQSRLGLYWLHQSLNRDADFQPTHRLLVDFYTKQNDPEKAAMHRRRLRGAAGQSSSTTRPSNDLSIENPKR